MMMRQLNRYPGKDRSDSGFTMIEVLVTLIILSIGLLGLAGLQANSMTNNHNAYLKSQAIIMANDIADRMRANIVGVRDGNYNSITTIPSDPGCISAGCSPAQMSTHDAFEWGTMLSDELPAGAGTVIGTGFPIGAGPPAAAGAGPITTVAGIFVITIRWDEARTGGTDCNNGLKCLVLDLTL